jgi:hypothetical protein
MIWRGSGVSRAGGGADPSSHKLKRAGMETNQLLGGQHGHGVSAPLVVAEFDLGDSRGKELNNRPHLAAHQTMRGQVAQQGNHGKNFQLRQGFSFLLN